MGPLIFMARRHQIKRKKSTLQYRLMQVNNQRQQIAEQMGQANKQKALRDSLFNVQSQMKMNNAMKGLLLSLGARNNFADATNAACQSAGIENNYSQGINQFSIAQAYNDLATKNMMEKLLYSCSSSSDEAELGQLQMIDSQLEQEQTSLENQLKLLEAEEQAVEKQMDQEIKNSAPKFGLSG